MNGSIPIRAVGLIELIIRELVHRKNDRIRRRWRTRKGGQQIETETFTDAEPPARGADERDDAGNTRGLTKPEYGL